MMRLLPLLTFAILVLSLSACLKETIVIDTPPEERLSNTDDLQFNEYEVSVLSQELNIPRTIEPMVTNIPSHVNNFFSQPETILASESDMKKALLGRVLFYDTRLSATGETSCATCHKQALAFSDDVAFSKGINGGITKRNSIALGAVPSFAPDISGYGSSRDDQNAAIEGSVNFFWDERAATVKDQSTATIQDRVEMGRDLHELSDDLKNLELYRILSYKAYGTTDLSPDRITLALEKFTSSISSMNTRLDHMINLEVANLDLLSEFSASEVNGRQLYLTHCASCHGSSLLKPEVTVANNGIDAITQDKGVGGITQQRKDMGVFKVPFLRNIVLTAPYMHDGRFNTLREVIDHYSENIKSHENLHPLLSDFRGEALPFHFSESEKDDIINFLELATDHELISKNSLSDPFKN